MAIDQVPEIHILIAIFSCNKKAAKMLRYHLVRQLHFNSVGNLVLSQRLTVLRFSVLLLKC